MDSKKLDACSRDAISLLPDELLGNILSSLPTKQAASTSVLSKKWRNVFTLVDNLDFDDSDYLRLKESKRGRSLKIQLVFPERFKKFVDKTLALQCDSPIKKFSLKCHAGYDEDGEIACVCRWISNVIERGVLELNLSIYTLRQCFLPCELFRSKTLVKLALGTELHVGPLAPHVSLPALKILLIDSVRFESSECWDLLLSGCPVLEELSVHDNWFIEMRKIISSPSIKRLSIRYDWETLSFKSFSLDTPGLVYLDYSDTALEEYPKCNLKSLVEARLDLRPSKLFTSCKVMDLILEISNVDTLHLSPDFVDVILRSYFSGLLLPVFSNLATLSFGSKYKQGWRLLPHMLENSPNLRTLIIKDLHGYASLYFVPQTQVKVLHILSYGGTDEELEHLVSFLRQLKSLEVVEVKVMDDDRKLQIKRDLTMLRIARSKCCRFNIC